MAPRSANEQAATRSMSKLAKLGKAKGAAKRGTKVLKQPPKQKQKQKQKPKLTCHMCLDGYDNYYYDGKQKKVRLKTLKNEDGRCCGFSNCDHKAYVVVTMEAEKIKREYSMCPEHAKTSTSSNYLDMVSVNDGGLVAKDFYRQNPKYKENTKELSTQTSLKGFRNHRKYTRNYVHDNTGSKANDDLESVARERGGVDNSGAMNVTDASDEDTDDGGIITDFNVYDGNNDLCGEEEEEEDTAMNTDGNVTAVGASNAIGNVLEDTQYLNSYTDSKGGGKDGENEYESESDAGEGEGGVTSGGIDNTCNIVADEGGGNKRGSDERGGGYTEDVTNKAQVPGDTSISSVNTYQSEEPTGTEGGRKVADANVSEATSTDAVLADSRKHSTSGGEDDDDNKDNGDNGKVADANVSQATSTDAVLADVLADSRKRSTSGGEDDDDKKDNGDNGNVADANVSQATSTDAVLADVLADSRKRSTSGGEDDDDNKDDGDNNRKDGNGGPVDLSILPVPPAVDSRCAYPPCEAAVNATANTCALCRPAKRYHSQCKAAYEQSAKSTTDLHVCLSHHPSKNEGVDKLDSLCKLAWSHCNKTMIQISCGYSGGDRCKDMVKQWNKSFTEVLNRLTDTHMLRDGEERKDLESPEVPTIKDVEELFDAMKAEILFFMPLILLDHSDTVSEYMNLLSSAFDNPANDAAAAGRNSNNNVKQKKTGKGQKKTKIKLDAGTEVQCQCCSGNFVAPTPPLLFDGVATQLPILRSAVDIEGAKESWMKRGVHDGIVYANPVQLRTLTMWDRGIVRMRAIWMILSLMPVQSFMNIYLCRAHKEIVELCYSKLVVDVKSVGTSVGDPGQQGQGSKQISSTELQCIFYRGYNEDILEKELYQKSGESWYNNTGKFLNPKLKKGKEDTTPKEDMTPIDMTKIVLGWDGFLKTWREDVMKVVAYTLTALTGRKLDPLDFDRFDEFQVDSKGVNGCGNFIAAALDVFAHPESLNVDDTTHTESSNVDDTTNVVLPIGKLPPDLDGISNMLVANLFDKPLSHLWTCLEAGLMGKPEEVRIMKEATSWVKKQVEQKAKQIAKLICMHYLDVQAFVTKDMGIAVVEEATSVANDD